MLSKPIEYILKRTLNYGLWVIMMQQCRLINCNKCITLVGDANNGESHECVGSGVYGKYLDFSLNFAGNQKLL